MQLDGKVALVTGSSRNIGRAIALAFAREGADIIVNAKTNAADAEAVANEIRALGRKAVPLLADVGDRDQLEGLMTKALAEFGHIDIVVNNASFRPNSPFVDMTYEEWRSVLAADLDASFITSKRAVPGMIERGWGRIINISGLLAFQGGHNGAHLATAKVGLIGLTRALSGELAPSGILANCIVPGLIETPFTLASPNVGTRIGHIPVGRHGTPDEIAGLCMFLCSKTSGYITGQTIHVNGGERTY